MSNTSFNATTNPLPALQTRIREFSAVRDWPQYHSPKNLAAALSVEAAELLEHFQWLTETQSRELDHDKRVAVGEEIADVFIYLLTISDGLGIDVIEAAHRKIDINATKYPVGAKPAAID